MSPHRAIIFLALAAACSTTPPRPLLFGGDRQVALQVPAAFDATKTYPLVMVLHGYGASGFVQESVFGLKALPNASEAFVLAPDGMVDSTGHAFWNADPACCDYDHTNPDDSGYLRGLIDDVMAAWPVDPTSVVMLGHSNGGYMAYRMACDHADVVTNAMVLAGGAASDPATCQPRLPVNVLDMNGTADGEVPYDPVALDSVAQWQMHDHCAATMTAGPDLDLDVGLPGAETHTATSDGCAPGLTVELWTIEGAGHVPSFGSTISDTIYQYLASHHRVLLPD